MKNTKLISLDTSSSISGWAVFINGKYNISGTIDYKTVQNTEVRMQKMCATILSLLDNEEPDIIVIENTVVNRNVAAQRMLTMILGVVYGWAISHPSTDFIMLRPTEWRAMISSEKKGRKREELKQWSLSKVKSLFSIDIDTDDESDAILIGQAYINKWKKGEK